MTKRIFKGFVEHRGQEICFYKFGKEFDQLDYTWSKLRAQIWDFEESMQVLDQMRENVLRHIKTLNQSTQEGQEAIYYYVIQKDLSLRHV